MKAEFVVLSLLYDRILKDFLVRRLSLLYDRILKDFLLRRLSLLYEKILKDFLLRRLSLLYDRILKDFLLRRLSLLYDRILKDFLVRRLSLLYDRTLKDFLLRRLSLLYEKILKDFLVRRLSLLYDRILKDFLLRWLSLLYEKILKDFLVRRLSLLYEKILKDFLLRRQARHDLKQNSCDFCKSVDVKVCINPSISLRVGCQTRSIFKRNWFRNQRHIIIIYSLSFSHQRYLIFHWSFSDSKSPQVSRTLLSILAVWMVSTYPHNFKSSSPFKYPLASVPKAPNTIGIIVSFMFHSFFNSLGRSRYLSFFSFSFNFTLWLAGQQLPIFCKFSFLCWLF